MPEERPKRVLIVDDAVVVRKALSDVLAESPGLAVSGTAATGRLAVEKFSASRPDIVLLDIEMPDMDGLEALRAIHKIDGRVPVIIFSTLTERGATATLDALALGASDYVTKPSNLDMAATRGVVLQELIPKIRALCRLPAQTAAPDRAVSRPAVIPPALPRPRPLAPVGLVAIGVSTGGPDALAHLLPSLPSNLPVPVVIAQHMPAIFTALLASRLSAKCSLPVRECVSGEPLVPGSVLIAPGNYHMVVSQEDGALRVRTHQGPKENFCRPSVDVLFRSIAGICGARTLAVVLTGMGQDGLKGCEQLRTRGARVYVQDEATSVVWGMPGFVARAGLADKVVPLDQMGLEIVRATANSLAVRRSS